MSKNDVVKAAENYLNTDNQVVLSEAKLQLLNAGVNAVEPLLDALVVRLRNLKSPAFSRSDTRRFLTELADKGYLRQEDVAEMLRSDFAHQPEHIPSDSKGMSLSQRVEANEVLTKVWQIISPLNELGIRSLCGIIKGSNAELGLVAALILNVEENPSDLLATHVRKAFPSEEEMERSSYRWFTTWLLFRVLKLADDPVAHNSVGDFCQRYGITVDDYMSNMVAEAIIQIRSKEVSLSEAQAAQAAMSSKIKDDHFKQEQLETNTTHGSVPLCAIPGCNYVAYRRCPNCNKVYCVQHIGSDRYDRCDPCTQQQELEYMRKQTRQKNQAYIVSLIGLGLLLVGGTAIWLRSELGGFHVLFVLLGIGLLWLGVQMHPSS